MFSSKSLMDREAELGHLVHGGALAVKYVICSFAFEV